jgi:hypothetical protein
MFAKLRLFVKTRTMMKTIAFFTACFVLLFQMAWAQDEPKEVPYLRKTSVTLVPQSFFASGLEAAVERMVGSKLSFKAYGAYYTADDHYWYNRAESMTQYKLELQPRIYINDVDKGIEGFFFGGSLNYRHIKLDNYEEDGIKRDIDAEALGIGFIFGQQVVAKSGFSFDWFVGGSLISPLNEYDKEKVHIGLVNPYKRGIVPKLGVSIGYAF